MQKKNISGYSIYNTKAQKKIKINPLDELFPELPDKKYSIIYADPPWDYGGKMQYDNSSKKDENIDFHYHLDIPQQLSISDIDLTSILSNGLENAFKVVMLLENNYYI